MVILFFKKQNIAKFLNIYIFPCIYIKINWKGGKKLMQLRKITLVALFAVILLTCSLSTISAANQTINSTVLVESHKE